MGDREMVREYLAREGYADRLEEEIDAMLARMAQRSAEQVAHNAKVRSDGYNNWPYQDKPV